MKTDQKLVIAMATIWLIAGVVEPHLPHAGQPLNEVGIAQSFVLVILLFAWCKAHAVSHQITAPKAAALLVGIIPPVGIPYYFFRGFGWREGVRGSLCAAGCLMGFVALYFASFALSAHIGF
ncbi:MAG TPA: hypothetical protein VFG49_05470 [Dyella sp.]|uniref:hypothetical protein n=1 Tax=Dyella sp. TaxID=1869338 RepID=UPI002D76C187|nr:hypothetical protein [Dyella sp.]HET6552972.1 hypothetical protein [Dyella sp.]